MRKEIKNRNLRKQSTYIEEDDDYQSIENIQMINSVVIVLLTSFSLWCCQDKKGKYGKEMKYGVIYDNMVDLEKTNKSAEEIVTH